MAVEPAYAWGVRRNNGVPGKPPFLLARTSPCRKDAQHFILATYGHDFEDLGHCLRRVRRGSERIMAVRVRIEPFGNLEVPK